MGKMNLLKANWNGKVGQTVGAKWKNRSTIRTYTKPSNPNTQAQQEVRAGFKTLTSFVALFADQIKYLSALDTSGMSVRNAILKVNKDVIKDETIALENLLISKGGLQKPQGVVITKDSSTNVAKATWTAPTATNFTEKAKAVIVAVQPDSGIVDVFTAAASAATADGTIAFTGTGDIYAFLYFIDERGSNKVGSQSVGSKISA